MVRTPLHDLGSALVRDVVALATGHHPADPAGKRLSALVDQHGPRLVLDLIAATPSPGRYEPIPDPQMLSALALALMVGSIGETGLPEHRYVREQAVDALLDRHGWTLAEASAIAVAAVDTLTGAAPCAHAHLATAVTWCRRYVLDV